MSYSKNHWHRTQMGGFTLLEILVVLVVVSLISTLLIQGFIQALNTQTRQQKIIYQIQQTTLINNWIKKSISGIIAVQSEQGQPFTGSSDSLQGFTTQALAQSAGSPANIHWSITQQDNNIQLRYRQAEHIDWQIFHRPRVSSRQNQSLSAGFQYRDEQGKWYQQWPPKNSIEKNQLPEAVQITLPQEHTHSVFLAVITATKNAKISTEDYSY